MKNLKTDTKNAAVMVLLGQSNASGHASPMRAEDKIEVPLKNVFGLSRKYNQSYDITELKWDGYLSGGKNLGEDLDHTYSLANCLARTWQDEIDRGNERNLPDLYIVQIAIGSEGVSEPYMWYPEREKKLVPGPLRIADISLYPLAEHILSLLIDSLEKLGKYPERVMIHWRGGEEDVTLPKEQIEKTLPVIYKRLLCGLRESLGVPSDVTLHKFRHKERCDVYDPSGEFYRSMLYVNDLFDRLSSELTSVSCFDIGTAPFYDESAPGYGIYADDLVHYTEKANSFAAKAIVDKYR